MWETFPVLFIKLSLTLWARCYWFKWDVVSLNCLLISFLIECLLFSFRIEHLFLLYAFKTVCSFRDIVVVNYVLGCLWHNFSSIKARLFSEISPNVNWETVSSIFIGALQYWIGNCIPSIDWGTPILAEKLHCGCQSRKQYRTPRPRFSVAFLRAELSSWVPLGNEWSH